MEVQEEMVVGEVVFQELISQQLQPCYLQEEEEVVEVVMIMEILLETQVVMVVEVVEIQDKMGKIKVPLQQEGMEGVKVVVELGVLMEVVLTMELLVQHIMVELEVEILRKQMQENPEVQVVGMKLETVIMPEEVEVVEVDTMVVVEEQIMLLQILMVQEVEEVEVVT